MNKYFAIIPVLSLIASCNTAIGSGGTYQDIPGKATVTEIKDMPNSPCAKSVSVFIDFKPDNPEDLKRYKFPDFSDKNFDIYSNTHPSRNWVEKAGIKVGNVYNAKRHEIISGTSTPFSFVILDKSVYSYYDLINGSYDEICK